MSLFDMIDNLDEEMQFDGEDMELRDLMGEYNA